MNACFSQSEAQAQIGSEIVTVAAFPEIPIGTRGRVVDAGEGGVRGWVVRVQWDLPPKRSEMLALVGDISFNIPWKTKRAPAVFSKSEYESLIGRVEA